jgi:NTE family protein|tara:strand:- start:2287 stop:3138 length:852 start_codon:yes stop_codon:yes gene_type:complete
MIENLVFSGAGVKIYTFIGFIKALDELNILKNVKSFIGTSSGSIIAALCVLDFKYKDIEDILLKINVSTLKSIDTENIMNFFNNYGLDYGKNFSRLFKIVLQRKVNNENITFKEMYDLTHKRLIVTATCVNTMEIEYFDHINTPDIPVLTAILMSISIPFIFNPVIVDKKFYVDGGFIRHYPIDFFENEKEKTLGVLVSNSLNEFKEINNIKDYTMNILQCSFVNLLKDCYTNYKENTILIENNDTSLDFDIEYNTKIALIDNAYTITKKRIESEEFKTYYDI